MDKHSKTMRANGWQLVKGHNIGRFKIAIYKRGSIYSVSIRPGTWVHPVTGHLNKETEQLENSLGDASYHYDKFVKFARNQNAFITWDKLNRVALPVYIRFQRMFAAKHNGKYVRGITINAGNVRLNLE